MKERERGGRTHINICKDCANHEEEHSWVRVDDVWSWGFHPDSGQDEKDKWCEERPQSLTPPQHLPSLISVWPAVIILPIENRCHSYAMQCSCKIQYGLNIILTYQHVSHNQIIRLLNLVRYNTGLTYLYIFQKDMGREVPRDPAYIMNSNMTPDDTPPTISNFQRCCPQRPVTRYITNMSCGEKNIDYIHWYLRGNTEAFLPQWRDCGRKVSDL